MTTATIRQLDEELGAVRVEDVFATDIQDLWDACTRPERLARWIVRIDGDPQVGATVRATFTSSWTGDCRIDVCEAPRHLLVTNEPGTDEESQLEAWLSEDGDRTRLVVEERGLPVGQLPYYGAGWEVHLEDLATSLASGERVHTDAWSAEQSAADWRRRWSALTALG